MFRSWEPYDCTRDCWDERNRRWNPRERAARGCQRVDLQPVEPDVYLPRVLHYHGRAADPELDVNYWPGLARMRLGDKEPWWRRPPEDHAEGCPGSWIHSPFAFSFGRYYRHRTESGGRVSNPLLDRADDWLLDEAVMYYERHEERRIAHHERIRFEAMEVRRQAATKVGGR